VYPTDVVPTLKDDPLACPVRLSTTSDAQLSLYVAGLKVATLAHVFGAVFSAMLEGHVTTGANTSVTLMLKLQLAVRPITSVTTNVCTNEPGPKYEPEADPTDWCVVDELQICVPTGVAYVTVRLQSELEKSTATSAGHVIVGRLPSNTSTLKLQSAVLLLVSVTRYVTVEFPTLKLLPLAPPNVRTRVLTPQLSLTVGNAYDTAISQPDTVVTLFTTGHVIFGGSVS